MLDVNLQHDPGNNIKQKLSFTHKKKVLTLFVVSGTVFSSSPSEFHLRKVISYQNLSPTELPFDMEKVSLRSFCFKECKELKWYKQQKNTKAGTLGHR